MHKKQLAWVAATVATVVFAGSVATVSAHSSHNNGDGNGSGYSKDQCKDGGWRAFKNPDGSMKFKNQGQCVSFFASGGNGNGNHRHGDGDNDNDDHGRSDNHHDFFGSFSQFFQHFRSWHGWR